MRNGSFLFLALLALSACNSQVTDFVKGGGEPSRSIASPIINEDDSAALKVSPGSVVATSPAVTMQATVTVTKRTLSSAEVGAEVSLSRSRVNP